MADADKNVREIIAEVLNINNDKNWDIVSQDEENFLYMVHHTKDADMSLFGSLRGVVVDIKNGNIVSHSYPYTPRVTRSSISDNEEGKIHLKDENGIEYDMDVKNLHFKTGFEGTLMHVFKHDGKVYHCTRKKLDSSRSRWGNSVKFGQMYEDLKGPVDEILFNTEKKYSPYCHTFIMVHPDVLVATRDDVGKGYLVYLGPKQMYSVDPNYCPYPLEDVDEDLHVPDTTTDPSDPNGIIFAPENLTLAEANKHLIFGFYDAFEGYEYLDQRTLPGEFVILEERDEMGNIVNMIRVESPSYAWRSSMRNNNPNLKHRFFELIDSSYLKNTPQDRDRYEKLFPILTSYDYECLKSHIDKESIVVWPQKNDEELDFPKTRNLKLYNLWLTYLVAVPLHRQPEVVKYYEQLVNKRTELIGWIWELSRTRADPTSFSKRMCDILIKTRQFAQDRVRKGQNIDVRTGKVKSVHELTRDNIRNFIYKELGPSLYRLIRDMDQFKREQSEAQKEANNLETN